MHGNAISPFNAGVCAPVLDVIVPPHVEGGEPAAKVPSTDPLNQRDDLTFHS